MIVTLPLATINIKIVELGIDREFVTSAKIFANFNEFSEIEKIRKKFVKCPSGRGLPTTTEEFDAFHGFTVSC